MAEVFSKADVKGIMWFSALEHLSRPTGLISPLFIQHGMRKKKKIIMKKN